MKKVTEAAILAQVKRTCKRYGLRFIRMSLRAGVEVGWPDVLVLGPNRGALFIETKAPGKTLKPIQKERQREVRYYGHAYAKIDSVEHVETVLGGFFNDCAWRGDTV